MLTKYFVVPEEQAALLEDQSGGGRDPDPDPLIPDDPHHKKTIPEDQQKPPPDRQMVVLSMAAEKDTSARRWAVGAFGVAATAFVILLVVWFTPLDCEIEVLPDSGCAVVGSFCVLFFLLTVYTLRKCYTIMQQSQQDWRPEPLISASSKA